ncbi:MAG: hypothetical protein CISAcid_15830 [uncultured Acidilobus sp. CIS]|nr:MAG: hypothetical protein CISAcid_15830 [uncultured Acidilobus sp. CIS]
MYPLSLWPDPSFSFSSASVITSARFLVITESLSSAVKRHLRT